MELTTDLVWHTCRKYPNGHAAVLTRAWLMYQDRDSLFCPASGDRVEVKR